LCAAKGDLQGMAESLRRLDMRWPDIKYCTEAIRILHDLKTHPDDLASRATASAWALAHWPEIGPEIVVPGIGPAWNDEADYAVYTAWAQVQIILGKTQEAMGVIEPILAVAQEHNLVHRVIQLSLLQAQVYYVQGQKDRVWTPLRLALSHAENNGYLRVIEQNSILIRLLIQAAKLGITPNYIRRILEIDDPNMDLDQVRAALPGIQHPGNFSKRVDGLIEPLSSREIEVLELMAQGLSNSAIAAHLYLSPNTLKAHTQNIFGKLDVHSRVQAVNKARELKLI
jgi:ATP/maltotriose-dependent transcriptional regulator MalT